MLCKRELDLVSWTGRTSQAQLSLTQSLVAENLEEVKGSPRKCPGKLGGGEVK